MAAFQRGGGFNKRPGPGGPRGNFGGPRRFGGNDRGTSGERFTAQCADCGDTCEVPFRPNGKKPVYCKACFPKHQDEGRNEHSDRFERRPQSRFERPQQSRFERRAEQFGRPHTPTPAAPDHRIDALTRDVASLNAKLDTLTALVQSLAPHKTIAPAPEKPAQKVAKKATKKAKRVAKK